MAEGGSCVWCLHCSALLFWLLPLGSLTAHVEEEEGGAQTGTLSLDTAQGVAWRYGSFVAKVQGRWQVGTVTFLNTRWSLYLWLTMLAEAKAVTGNRVLAAEGRGPWQACREPIPGVFCGQVAFVAGGAGGGPASYIALDDFFVKEGGCSEPGGCTGCHGGVLLWLLWIYSPIALIFLLLLLSFLKRKENIKGTGEGSPPDWEGCSTASFLLGKTGWGLVVPVFQIQKGSLSPFPWRRP